MNVARCNVCKGFHSVTKNRQKDPSVQSENRQSVDRAFKHRGVGNIKGVSFLFQNLTGGVGFLHTTLSQFHIRPAGEAVFFIPRRLSVAEEDDLVHDDYFLWRCLSKVRNLQRWDVGFGKVKNAVTWAMSEKAILIENSTWHEDQDITYYAEPNTRT